MLNVSHGQQIPAVYGFQQVNCWLQYFCTRIVCWLPKEVDAHANSGHKLLLSPSLGTGSQAS